MRKHLLLSGAFLLFASIMMAEPITQRQALQQARQFFSSHGITVSSQAKIFRAPSKQTTQTSAYYVFNAGDDKGFAIVSGDDRTVPILGYSLNGSFTDENMPENLKSWLAEYQRQIEYIQKNNITLDNSQSTATDRAKIPEMLTTEWSQTEPYNNTCPVFSDGNRSVTGCVATAMAQVLYYNWQQNPSKMSTQTLADMPSYQTNFSDARNITVPAISAGAPIDWSNMLPTYYNVSSTNAQKTAVANLMLYCGTAVQMQYSSSESAALSNAVPTAFAKYFGMDASARVVDRNADYTSKQWNDLIYNELANNRVVYYSGASAANSGHAFVIDGYEGNNYFHLNWGWGGMDDGAYVLSLLAPPSGGTGAGTIADGYNYGQQAVINAAPDHGGKAALPLYFADYTVSKDTVKFSVYNMGTDAIRVDVGIGYVASDGTITVIESDPAQYSWKQTYGGMYYYLLSSLKNGEYDITPIAKLSSDTEWQTIRPGMTVHATVRNGIVSFDQPSAKLRMVGEISTTANATANLPCKVECTIANDGNDDFDGALHLFASTTSDKGSAVDTPSFGAIAGGENTLSATWTPNAAGTYTLWLCTDAEGKNVIGSIDNVVVNAGRTLGTNFTVSSVEVKNTVKDSQFIDSDGRVVNYVTGNSLNGSFVIGSNENSGNQAQYTQLYKYNESSNSYNYYGGMNVYYPQINFSSGSLYSISFNFDNLADGKYYVDFLVGAFSGSTIPSPVYHNDLYAFIIGGKPTGIESVRNATAQDDVSAVVTVYNMQGMKVGTMPRDRISTLPHGLYIVNGKKIVVR